MSGFRWFADDLIRTMAAVPGSPEREHLLTLLRTARRIRVTDSLAQAASRTMVFAPDDIEQHLDFVSLDHPCVWLEADHLARSADTVSDITVVDIRLPHTVGWLLAIDPTDPAHIVVFSGWRTGLGHIHHAYGLLHWDCRLLYQAMIRASAADGNALERLLELGRTTVPPGFQDELDIMAGQTAANDPRRDLMMEQTQRDVGGEHMFLLALVLMMRTSAVRLKKFVRPAEVEPVETAPHDAAIIANDLDSQEAVEDGVQDDVATPDPDHWIAQLEIPKSWRWPRRRSFYRSLFNADKLHWQPDPACSLGRLR